MSLSREERGIGVVQVYCSPGGVRPDDVEKLLEKASVEIGDVVDWGPTPVKLLIACKIVVNFASGVSLCTGKVSDSVVLLTIAVLVDGGKLLEVPW